MITKGFRPELYGKRPLFHGAYDLKLVEGYRSVWLHNSRECLPALTFSGQGATIVARKPTATYAMRNDCPQASFER